MLCLSHVDVSSGAKKPPSNDNKDDFNGQLSDVVYLFVEPRRKNVSCAIKNAFGIFDAPASLQHLVPPFTAKTCHHFTNRVKKMLRAKGVPPPLTAVLLGAECLPLRRTLRLRLLSV